MREAILETGFEDLRFAKAAFVLRNDDNNLGGIFAVHVDDGVWAGKGVKYERA